MDVRLVLGQKRISLAQTKPVNVDSKKLKATNAGRPAFETVLLQAVNDQARNDFRVSAHAKKRLYERNINLNEQLVTMLNKAFDELSLKGAKDSLVITNEGAFVVNVPSRTMVTALGANEMKGSVITNIDSVSVKYI